MKQWAIDLYSEHVARFSKIPKTPAKRQSFRLYWREIRSMASLRDLPRREKRKLALQWYRERKRPRPQPYSPYINPTAT